MTSNGGSDRGAAPPDLAGPAWRFTAILVLAFALRLSFALTHPIDYNAYWHVFIARNLEREYGSILHPPFFLVLLRLADMVSHSSLAYQSVSLFAGLGVVALTRSILLRLGVSGASADLAALTMAVAQPAVILSCGVQSYMLAALFIFGSFLPYMKLVGHAPPRGRHAAAFAMLVSLGLLTEYYTAFYMTAAALAPFLVAASRRSYRRALGADLPRRLLRYVVAFAIPAAVAAAVYLIFARPWVHRMESLPDFYFRPGLETAVGFLVRNLWNLFNIFAPFTLWSPGLAAALLLSFVAVVFLLAVADRRRDPSSDARIFPAAILILLFGIGMSLGLKGPYPFGGLMRQQFLYFLFAVPAGFVAFDRVLPGITKVKARAAIAGGAAALLMLNLAWHARDFRNVGRLPFERQVRAFHQSFPEAAVIHVDSLNLIGFFTPHHDWNWRFAGKQPHNAWVERYELEKNGRRMTMVAHRDTWNFDFQDPALYRKLRAAMAPGDPDCFQVFCVHTNLYKPAERRLPDLEAGTVKNWVGSFAPPAGLVPERLEIRGNDVYVQMCRSPR